MTVKCSLPKLGKKRTTKIPKEDFADYFRMDAGMGVIRDYNRRLFFFL